MFLFYPKMSECRVLNLPQCQYLSSSLNNQQNSAAHPSESSDKKASKQRYNFVQRSAVLPFVTDFIVANCYTCCMISIA